MARRYGSTCAAIGSDRSLAAIDHLDLVVTDLERSLGFYSELLRPLGYVRQSEITGERGERVIYLDRAEGRNSVSLRQSQSEARPAPYDRYAVGLHHLAFAAAARTIVDECARWVAAQGMTLESPPREYDYTPGYYAVFFYDPDGIKLEIVHRPDERDLAQRVSELAQRVTELERRR